MLFVFLCTQIDDKAVTPVVSLLCIKLNKTMKRKIGKKTANELYNLHLVQLLLYLQFTLKSFFFFFFDKKVWISLWTMIVIRCCEICYTGAILQIKLSYTYTYSNTFISFLYILLFLFLPLAYLLKTEEIACNIL